VRINAIFAAPKTWLQKAGAMLAWCWVLVLRL
jgi:hypothetical protein